MPLAEWLSVAHIRRNHLHTMHSHCYCVRGLAVLLNSIRQIEDGYIYGGVRTPVSTIYTRLHIWFESALIITELDLLRNRQRISQNCYIYKESCAIQRLVG